jgi:hypothetical protein
MTCVMGSKYDPTLKNISHPLDKIFGGIPAGSCLSPTLQRGMTRIIFSLLLKKDLRAIFHPDDP